MPSTRIPTHVDLLAPTRRAAYMGLISHHFMYPLHSCHISTTSLQPKHANHCPIQPPNSSLEWTQTYPNLILTLLNTTTSSSSPSCILAPNIQPNLPTCILQSLSARAPQSSRSYHLPCQQPSSTHTRHSRCVPPKSGETLVSPNPISAHGFGAMRKPHRPFALKSKKKKSLNS